jgi:tetratricopeptide (TPR) repeat protein
LRNFDDAQQDLREALRISRKLLGRNHKVVAQTLCHIACLYYEAGELFSAQATFEDGLEIYRQVFAQETTDRDSIMAQMTETLCNIGSIQNKRKSFSEAIPLFREALDLQRGIMGHNHPRVIATLDNLGFCYSKQKAYYQALTCYKEMLTAQISHDGGEFTGDSLVTLKKQNLIYEKLNNLDGAMMETSKALKTLKKGFLGEDDPLLLEIQTIIGELSLKQQKRESTYCQMGCF